MEGSLQCIEVGRSYPSFTLKPLSFEVRPGYLTGLVGRNGAGKTTLLNILAGLDERYVGDVVVDGVSFRDDYEAAKEKVAIVSERISFFMDKTPLENSEFLGFFFKEWSTEEFYRWLDLLKVPKGQPLYQFSKGTYMKYQFAFAMAHRPRYLLLDEPTAGFDPVFRREFVDLIQDIRDQETGILMSTHILSDIEQVADYIMWLEQGKLISYNERDEIGNRLLQEFTSGQLNQKKRIGDLLK